MIFFMVWLNNNLVDTWFRFLPQHTPLSSEYSEHKRTAVLILWSYNINQPVRGNITR